MAYTNYTFAKRQREIAKQKKKEEKRLRKATKQDSPQENPAPVNPAPPPAQQMTVG